MWFPPLFLASALVEPLHGVAVVSLSRAQEVRHVQQHGGSEREREEGREIVLETI